MSNEKLSGKVALVRGSSRGIGRAIALGLGQDAANLVVTYAGNKDKAEEVVSTLKANGSEVIAIQVDMRNLEDVRNLFRVKTVAGVTATDGLVLEQAQVDQMITQTLGRLGEPADIANAVALLMSDNARWITGHIRANGGMV